MRFGFFFQLPCASGQSERERYRDTLAQIEHDDRLSFDTVLLAELHFVPEFSDMFSPLTVAAAAAERTKRARSCIAASREMLNALEGLSLATNKSGSRRSFG